MVGHGGIQSGVKRETIMSISRHSIKYLFFVARFSFDMGLDQLTEALGGNFHTAYRSLPRHHAGGERHRRGPLVVYFPTNGQPGTGAA
jgi:hypothetical protein